MTIPQRHIRNFKCRYHRNGVAGEGFYACEFMWLDGNRLQPMRAVLLPNPAPVGSCFVLSESIADRWRGDDFEPALREAIKLVEAAQPETIYG